MKIGIIGGSALVGSERFPNLEKKIVATKYGKVEVLADRSLCFLNRHARGLPPHMINHRANISVFEKLGIKEVIGISSVGSLKESLAPGTLVVIDDYIQLSGIQTFNDKELKFVVPGFSERLRKILIGSARQLGIDFSDKGTYIQTQGPRFETKAEIRMFSRFADVVGMTLGNEITLAKEKGLDYACMCSVDNYANGIGQEINWEKIQQIQKRNVANIRKILELSIGKIR